MEIIYEYSGDDLLSLMEKEKPENIMRYMTSVAETMKVLEKNNISHYDLKPENIVRKGEEVKIIDFCLSRLFESEARYSKTTVVYGYSELYSPPEVIKNERGHPVKIDVFCWGMSLYQLITKKSIKHLEDELKLRKKDHRQFLEQIKAIKISGNPDLTRKTREILLRVLNEEYKKRPTFTELCELLQDGKTEELERSRNLREQAAKNNEEVKEEVKESYTEMRHRLFKQLKLENIKVYEEVKRAYDNIIAKEDLCDLHGVCIGDKGVRLLVFALNESNNLKVLNLGLNKIQVEGIKVLAEGLKRCNTLEILILGEEATSSANFRAGNSKGNLGKEILKMAIAPGAIAGVGVLAQIARGTGIGAKLGGAIAKVTGVAAAKVAAWASGASVLIKVGVCTLGVGLAIGAVVIAGVVIYKAHKNHCEELESKSNKSNNLGTTGTIAIAVYLKNSKLTGIDLSYCNISSEAIQYLVAAANACNTLKFINIKGNPKLKGIKPEFREGLKNQY